jgi:DNA-binding FrmR family transcriptional regulator
MRKSTDLTRLLNRLGRIKGQLNGIENALIDGKNPFTILQTAAACRGAINGLMAEIIESRISALSEESSPEKLNEFSDLIEIVRAYLK